MVFIINPYQVQPSGGGYGALATAWIKDLELITYSPKPVRPLFY